MTREDLVGKVRQPALLPAFLQGKPLISVSRMKTKQQPHWTYVYRYSFKADYEATIRRATKELKGWISDKTTRTPSLERELKTGPIAFQALLFIPTRLVPDPASSGRSRPLPATEGKGWVWISYNERPRN